MKFSYQILCFSTGMILSLNVFIELMKPILKAPKPVQAPPTQVAGY